MTAGAPLSHGLARIALWAFCLCVLFFLAAPILVVVPLSFNAEVFLNFPIKEFSLRWYAKIIADPYWQSAALKTLIVGSSTAMLSTVLGTLAALGLSSRMLPARSVILAILLTPLIIPLIIIAISLYFFFARIGLIGTLTGLVIGHTLIATPFVVLTVLATLAGYDWRLNQAAASLGAGPGRVFRTVTLPLVLPGIATGALFAFAVSLDEIVIALFVAGSEQHTIPRAIWRGVRQEIDPTILAVACLLILLSVVLLGLAGLLRHRTARITVSSTEKTQFARA
jgi:putative spermidine/putrescine transport system permease protein